MAAKNEPEFSDILVSSKVLESLLGVKDRTIRDLADKGIVKRDSHGKYFLWKSASNYIKTLKIINAGKSNIQVDDDEDALDLDTERAAHEHIKRQISEVKLQLILGQVHKAEDVEAVMTDMFERFRSKMNAIPSKMAKRLEGKERLEIQKLLRKEIEDALTELSEYNPADFYSDEHIEIAPDAITALGGTDDAGS